MHTISQSAIWVKEPLADTGVVIVTSAALPKYMIDKLHMAIDDWDQVAYLVVQQSRAFMLDWLQFGSNPIDTAPATTCRASQLLRGVSKGCFYWMSKSARYPVSPGWDQSAVTHCVSSNWKTQPPMQRSINRWKRFYR